jgi:hypothetical protein
LVLATAVHDFRPNERQHHRNADSKQSYALVNRHCFGLVEAWHRNWHRTA